VLAGMGVCAMHEAACLQTQKLEDDNETKQSQQIFLGEEKEGSMRILPCEMLVCTWPWKIKVKIW